MKHTTPSRVWVTWLVGGLLTLAACSPTPTEATPVIATPSQTATAAPLSSATKPPPTEASTPTHSAQEGCPASGTGEVDPATVLELGPGPGIPATTASGEKLVISGTVYTADCTPLAGAVLDVWQTDANGVYGPGHGTDDMRCCYLMGSLRTDTQGRYQLITVKPGHYEGEPAPPPAHIHMEISHPQADRTQAEIVFAGDPYLPQNLTGFHLVSLETVPASDQAAAYLHGKADIILAPPGD
jgi:protocatechuate 3,4-dioxygenase beta subunit